MYKRKFKKFLPSLFCLPLFFIPFCTTSCGVSFSELKNRTIDPSVLKTFNMWSNPLLTFNHTNCWNGSDECAIQNTQTTMVYVDKNNQIEGGVVLDQSDMNSRTDITNFDSSNSTGLWENRGNNGNDATKTYYLDDTTGGGSSWLGFVRDGKNTPNSDNCGKIPWVNNKQELQYLPNDKNKQYYVCANDLWNDLVYSYNPYNTLKETSELWYNMIENGWEISDYLSYATGQISITNIDNRYCKWLDTNKINSGTKQKDFVIAEINCERLVKALLNPKQWAYSIGSDYYINLVEGNGDVQYQYKLQLGTLPSTKYSVWTGKLNSNNTIENEYSWKLPQGKTDDVDMVPTLNPDYYDNQGAEFIRINSDKPIPFLNETFCTGYIGIEPYKAVEWTSPETSGDNYLTLQNFNKPESYYSGHYVPVELRDQLYTIYVQNKHFPSYSNSENGSIKKIICYEKPFLTGNDAIKAYENGDSTLSYINNFDKKSWDKYVGENENDPKFKYTFNTFFTNSTYTQNIFFNLYNKEKLQNNLPLTSEVFAIPSFRAYWNFLLDKNHLNSYSVQVADTKYIKGSSSGKLTYNPNTDSFESSVATANIFVQGKNITWTDHSNQLWNYEDYENYLVKQQYQAIIDNINNNANKVGAITSSKWENMVNKKFSTLSVGQSNSVDAIRFNPFIGLTAFGDLSASDYFSSSTSGYSQLDSESQSLLKNFITAIENWSSIDINASDLQKQKKDALDDMVLCLQNKTINDIKETGIPDPTIKPLSFDFLIMATDVKDKGVFLNDTLDSISNYDKTGCQGFKKIVTINKKTVPSKQQFVTSQKNGTFDLLIGGWGADYHDPTSALSTAQINGSYDITGYHWSNIFDSTGVKPDLNYIANNNNKMKNYFDDMYNILSTYSTNIKNDNKLSIANDRYENLAKLEGDAIYKTCFIMPSSYPCLPSAHTLGYVNQESITNNGWTIVRYEQFKQQSKLTPFNTQIINGFYRDFSDNCIQSNITNPSETDFNNYLSNNWQFNDPKFNQPTYTEFVNNWMDQNQLKASQTWRC